MALQQCLALIGGCRNLLQRFAMRLGTGDVGHEAIYTTWLHFTQLKITLPRTARY